MRTILIIQSLIILIGAYYIYTLSSTSTKEPETQVLVLPADDSKRSTENTDIKTNKSDAISTVTEDISATTTLPTDIGMEYPTMQ